MLEIGFRQPLVFQGQAPIDQKTACSIHRQNSSLDAVGPEQMDSTAEQINRGSIQVQVQLAGGEDNAHVPNAKARISGREVHKTVRATLASQIFQLKKTFGV